MPEPRRVNKCDLAPPAEVIQGARSVLGTIDLDPYSTPDINRAVIASRFYDRDLETLDSIVHKDWECSGEGRVFVGAPTGAALTRRLVNKTLTEYRTGRIDQAVLWLAHNEAIIRLPWLWDFPVCIPFRRLRPQWWDDELETFRGVSPSDWSAIVYLPPPANPSMFQSMLSRFHNVFGAMGRVVFNEYSGQGDWDEAYQALYKKPYDYRS
jgi:hypothetical protein|tara:strand:+ start:1809 stop:2438 length:630 start_codon:yes stop_codon:yes gene_type:complete